MKSLFCTLIILFSVNSYSYNCANYTKEKPIAMKALKFIKKFQGKFKLGACDVEITVCDGWEETIENRPLAEIMLVDQYDREIYMTLAYPEEQSWYFATKTQINKRMLNFKKWDRYYEEDLGRTEHEQVEILTEWDNVNKISSLHVGMYSTNNQLNQPNGNDSTWSICED